MSVGEQNPSEMPDALSWLLEMELVTSPYVLNSIILNMFMSVKGMKNAEFVIDEQQKKILIFLELGWYYRKFKQANIEAQVKEMIDQILPSFKKRIVFNREILDKALSIMKDRSDGKGPQRPKLDTSTPLNQNG